MIRAVKRVATKLQGILELLGDGRFHGLDELQEETELSENETRAIVSFLAEYGFAEILEPRKRESENQQSCEKTVGTSNDLARAADNSTKPQFWRNFRSRYQLFGQKLCECCKVLSEICMRRIATTNFLYNLC